ncbi:MAG TPA: hypothetical protein VKA86_00320 [Candidatus Krumholzibacteria bacterium]|nr:hypothetical protein [Candidatus Krumholzibacteria bacterium]
MPAVAQTAQDARLLEALERRTAALPESSTVFVETWLLPVGDAPSADSPDELLPRGKALVLQLQKREYLSLVARLDDPASSSVEVLCDATRYYRRTPQGDRPLETADIEAEPFVLLALEGPAGAASARRVVASPDGGITAVVLREWIDQEVRPEHVAIDGVAVANDPGFVRLVEGIDRGVSDQWAQSAAPRGVEEIEEGGATVSVRPDTSAVKWMESIKISPLALETFRLQAGLPPYHLLRATEAEGLESAEEEDAR